MRNSIYNRRKKKRSKLKTALKSNRIHLNKDNIKDISTYQNKKIMQPKQYLNNANYLC
jgi:hypothetical protein